MKKTKIDHYTDKEALELPYQCNDLFLFFSFILIRCTNGVKLRLIWFMNLVKSTGTFGFYTIISRILGYLRDVLIAIFLGTSFLADAFFVATKKASAKKLVPRKIAISTSLK